MSGRRVWSGGWWRSGRGVGVVVTWWGLCKESAMRPVRRLMRQLMSRTSEERGRLWWRLA